MNEQNQSLTPSSPHSVVKTTEEGPAGKSITTSQSTAAEMVAEQTRAEVYGAMTLAKKFPRDEALARQSIVAACESIKFAEKAIFKKPIGNRQFIEGPSIRFAEEMVRHWGNIKTYQFAIYDDPTRRIIRVVCYDLQSNNSYSVDAIIEKTVERKSAKNREVLGERTNSYGEKVSIVRATEDEMMIKEGAKASKMIRNNSLRLVPAHIVEEAVEAARSVIKSGASKNIDGTIKQMTDDFKELGIEVVELEKYLKHPMTQVTVDEIADLKIVYRSIKDGDQKWSDYIADGEVKQPEVVTDDAQPHGNPSDFYQKPTDEKHQPVA